MYRKALERQNPWGRISIFVGIALLLHALLGGLSSCSVSRNKAEQAERQGEYAKASSLYSQLYRRTPSRSKELRSYYAWRTAENYRRGRVYPRALNFYRSAQRYNYPDSVLLLRLGQMLHTTGQWSEAEEYYKRYQAADPESYSARIGLAGCRLAQSARADALRYEVSRANEWNSSGSDFAPIYSPDGAYIYFTSSRGGATADKSDITTEAPSNLWVVRRDQNGRWSQRPDTLRGGLNSIAEEGVGSLTPDGTTLYYTHAEKSELYNRTAQIYQSNRSRERSWSAGTVVDVWRDSVTMAAHPALSPSGRTMFFVSDVLGGIGGKDIYQVSLGEGGIGTPTPLGMPINTPGDELYPMAVSDSIIYFASDGHPGYGGLDIYKARLLPSGQWRVEHLPEPINSPADDYSIAFDPKLDESNGGNAVAERGLFASTRGDGRGRPHLYRFELPKITTQIAGYVMDRDEYAIAGATIKLVGSTGGGERMTHTRQDGSYDLSASGEVSYVMLASAPGYLNQYATFTTGRADSSLVYQVDFRLASRIDTELLEHIYYDFDKADLRAESHEALEELRRILGDNPDISIELSAHADRVGAAEYNEQLSTRRAESVVRYLIDRGIEPTRLKAVGYGQRKPATVSRRQAERYPFLQEGQVLDATFVEALEPESRAICDALNRRTEFVVLSTDN